MFRVLSRIGIVLAAAFATMQLQAIVIWDVTDVVKQEEKVSWLETFDFTHDLMNPTSGPSGLGTGALTAYEGQISIEIWDDGDHCGLFTPLGCEAAVITVADFDFDSGGVAFGSTFVGELEVNALGEINKNGMLHVSVFSLLGDFFVGNSTVELNVREGGSTVSVPEPGVLALLGLGLVGLRAARLRA